MTGHNWIDKSSVCDWFVHTRPIVSQRKLRRYFHVAPAPNSSTSAAICSSVWPQVKLIRRQASPSGTVGGRIAGTSSPRSRSRWESSTARFGSPIMIGMIWLAHFCDTWCVARTGSEHGRPFSGVRPFAGHVVSPPVRSTHPAIDPPSGQPRPASRSRTAAARCKSSLPRCGSAITISSAASAAAEIAAGAAVE